MMSEQQQTTIFVKPVFSGLVVSHVPTHVGQSNLHCYDICRTSLVCFLVFGAPSSNDVSEVIAFVLYLRVITHRM